MWYCGILGVIVHSVLTRCNIQLGISDDLKDPIFSAGQLADASKNLADDGLSDPGIVTGSKTDPAWELAFKQTIHCCLIITGESLQTVRQRQDELDRILLNTIKIIVRVDGAVRPGSEHGHEHFGFQDGLSQPPIIGFRKPNAGEDPTRNIPSARLDSYSILIVDSDSTWRHSPWGKR